MSSEMGTSHSHDNLETVGSMKGKELGPWLMKLVRDRTLPFTSLSRLKPIMPPIIAGIWRRLSSISPLAINLPIMRSTSIASLIKPASLSSVWRHLIDLPLLGRRRQRTSQFLQASDAVAEEQLFSNTDLGRYEQLTDEYSSIIPAIGAEPPAGLTGEPYLSEHLLRVHEVGEKRPVRTIDEVHPLVRENLPLSPIAESKQPHTGDSSQRPVYPSSTVRQPVRMMGRALTTDAGQLADSRLSAAVMQQSGQIQEAELKRSEQVEGRQPQASEYSQPAYGSRRLDIVGAQFTKETSLKYGRQVLPQASESAVMAHRSHRLDRGRLPIAESPVADLKQSTIGGQNIPLAQPLSVLRRSYLKIGDTATKTGRETPDIPYIVDNLSIEEASLSDSAPVQSWGGYHQPLDLPVESGVPAISGTMLSRPEPLTRLRLIGDVNKSVLSPLTHSILQRDQGVKYLDVKTFPHRIIEAGQSETSIVPASLLPGLAVENARTRMTSEYFESVPAQKGAIISSVLPTHEAKGLAASRAEVPLLYTSAAELYGEKPPVRASHAQIPASPVQRYWKSTEVPPVDRDRNGQSLLSRVKESPSLIHGEAEQTSFERMFPSVSTPKAGVYVTGGDGVSLAVSKRSADYPRQPVRELALAPERNHAEEVVSEPALTPVMRHAEVVSRQPARAEGEAGEETGEAGAPDIDAIARDVYSILKRTIRRERERTYGFS